MSPLEGAEMSLLKVYNLCHYFARTTHRAGLFSSSTSGQIHRQIEVVTVL